MKKFKVYITTIHEVEIEARDEELAGDIVEDNLSDYYIDANLIDCGISNIEEVFKE